MTRQFQVVTLTGVDRSSAIGQLPAVHAVAIRLRDNGLGDQVIAVAVGIDEPQVPMLLRIAEKKLANIVARDSVGPLETDDISNPQAT